MERNIKVKVENLCKSFGDLKVIENCNFHIYDGEFVCVVGPTGCGKTTFLNMLSSLLEPTSGVVLIDGEKASPQKHNLSFIFQEPSAFPWLTVEKNIAYGLRAKNKNEAYIKEQTDHIIELMGLEKYRNSFPGELSTSTEQKIVIGRAFAMNPDLLLMDEPYGQMDVKTRFYLEDEVIRIWKEYKKTVVFITHNIEEAVYLAERVLILTNKPARVKEDVSIDLPHPRNVNDPEFVRLRNYITSQIKWEKGETMKKPNLLYIMVDHQIFYRHGWDFGPRIIRKNYEEFACGGVEFTQAYSANPLCGPTRRTVLTGLYSHHHGEVLNDVNVPFSDRTYLQILSDNGYRNYYYGKWHAGMGTAHDHGCEGYCYPSYGNPYLTPEYKAYLNEKQLPEPRIRIECTMDPWRLDLIPGKDYIQDKEWSNEQASGILLTPKETHEAFFLADMVCAKLEEIKKSDSDAPFSLRLDFWGPHDPYFVTREYADMYPPEDIPMYPTFDSPQLDKPCCYRKEHNLGIADADQNLIYPNPIPWKDWQLLLSRCYAHSTMIDDAVGLVLKKLKELGLDENTLIIWTADHGDAIACQGGKFDKASYMVEEVMRIPMAMCYSGVIKPGQVTDALVSNMDVPVTLLAAAGLSFDYSPDGIDLLKLEKSGFHEKRDFFVSETYGHLHRNVAKSMVTGRYKYTVNKEDLNELYDLVLDPYETKNLIFSEKHLSLVKELDAKLHKWVKEQGDIFYDGDSEYILQKYFSRGTSAPRDY